MQQPKDQPLLINISKEDRKILENLAEYWRVSLAEAIRRAVRETWRRENR